MASKSIQIEIPITVQDNTSGALSSIQGRLRSLGSAADTAGSKAESFARRSTRSFDSYTQSTRRGFDQMTSGYSKSTKGLDSLGKSTGKALSSIEKIASAGKQIAGKAWNVTVGVVDKVTAPLKSIMSSLSSPLMAAGITIGASATMTDVIKTYAGFEAEMSKVQAISGATSDELTQLTSKAKEMGSKTKFTAEESAQAFEYMAMAGWKTQDMLSGIEGIMNLASASGEDLASVSDIVTDALTAFGLKAQDSTHFADVLAAASSNSNTNVGLMGNTFQYVGSIAGAMGYSIEDTATAIGLMANSGIKGEKAGTALRSIITRLADPPKEAAEAMDALNLSVTNSDGSMRSLGDVMTDLRNGFSGLTQEQKASYASSIAGKEAMSGLLSIVNASQADYDKLSEAINNADGASQSMSDTMLNNLSGKWTLFQSALDGVKISLGERIEPYLMDAIQWMTDKLPDLEDGLMSAMDKIDDFVSDSKKKFAELQTTDEWRNADFFGKAKLSFDKIIGEPFSEWWDSTGRAWFANKAEEIGQGFGSAISTGIMALLGLDVTSAVDDGASIGASFAKGFTSGFQGLDIGQAFMSEISKVFSNAGGFLTGNNSLSGLLSTILIARIGGPLIKGIAKAISGGMQLGTIVKQALGSASLVEGIDGSVSIAGTGLVGGLAKAGMALGSGATSAAGLAAAGAGGVAGGIVGGISAVSGGVDAYTAYTASKAGDADKSEAYGKSAAWKLGGVGTGAATGALIGSIIPGLGTAVGALVGAGVGGIAGMIGGKKYTDAYKQNLNYQEKSVYALKDATFQTQELKDAFDDTNVSAEEFGRMIQQAGQKVNTEMFGGVHLTNSEIKEATKSILNMDTDGLEAYSAAASDAQSSLSSLSTAQYNVQKDTWKLHNNLLSTDEGMQIYISDIQEMEKATKSYLDDSQYRSEQAISLLTNGLQTRNFTTGISSATTMKNNVTDQYASYQRQYNALAQQIDDIIGDGEISSDKIVTISLGGFQYNIDEQAAVQKLQDAMNELTDNLTGAEYTANLQAAQIKFEGGSLDYESFNNLMSDISSSIEDATSDYDEALTVTLTNLNLQLKDGAITQDEFNEQLGIAKDGYVANVGKLKVEAEGFAFDSITEAFGTQLDGILPELTGTTSEKLQQAFNDAVSQGLNLGSSTTLSDTDYQKLFGLDNLSISEETKSALVQDLKSVYDSLSPVLEDTTLSDSMSQAYTDAISNMDTSDAVAAFNDKTGDIMNAVFAQNGPVGEDGKTSGFAQALQDNITSSIKGADLSGAGDELNAKLSEALTSGSSKGTGTGTGTDTTGLTQALESSMESSVESADFSGVGAAINNKIAESMSSVDTSGGENADMSGITTSLETSMQNAVDAADFSSAATSLQTKTQTAMTGVSWNFSGISAPIGASVGSAIGAATGWESGVSSLYSAVDSAIQSQFASGFSVSTSVAVTIAWHITNPTAHISTSGSGSTVSASIAHSATGRITHGPMLSYIGEDGPEAVIPLSAGRRGRGVDLWKQAGRMMGIPGFANGTVVDNGNDTEDSFSVNVGAQRGNGETGAKDAPTVNVTINPSFVIQGSNMTEDELMSVIKAHMKELTEDVSSMMADRLTEVYSNMPA